MKNSYVPLALRLAGLWLLWSAWCSSVGWVLSALHLLTGVGYLLFLPALLLTGWHWLRTTAPPARFIPDFYTRVRRLILSPLPAVYSSVVLLTLLGALMYTPWSFDATTYRLPRLLYWRAAHHWYWIGTLDHRLDFSSCGFEWQMLPILELTRSDRLLFLLNWIPLLLLPSLTFVAFRGLGASGRTARTWMWVLPTAYCVALQAGGIQNDGYAVNFLLGAIAFSILAFYTGRIECLLMSIVAAGLLTGAKLSNLPLLLPVALVWLPSLHRIRWLDWRVPAAVMMSVLSSCLPLACLCSHYTGSWTGDPGDQWGGRPMRPLGAAVANALLFINDAAQPPVLPGSKRLLPAIQKVEEKARPVMTWLQSSHPHFPGFEFGEMAYEGTAGLGFGVSAYTLFLLIGQWFVRGHVSRIDERRRSIPAAWQIAPATAWVSYAVFLMSLGFAHTPRIAAPYYPLLLLSIVRGPRIAALSRSRLNTLAATLAAASVLPVIVLTPSRPLLPEQLLSWMSRKPALQPVAAKYQLWAGLRDDLAPLRAALPPGMRRLGYACGFRDTSYGLWKPFGSREIVELGLPLGRHTPPPADLNYAVVTPRGLKDRYGMDVESWCTNLHGQIVFEMKRDTALDAHTSAKYESWYLVKLQ
jgi:hypothetical protein